MRPRTLAALLAALSLATAGRASGVRVGGDRYGAGVGGFVGPTPAPALTSSAVGTP